MITLPKYIRCTAKLAVLVMGATVWALAFSTGAPIYHTGGFKDPDCTRCHSDFPVDSGRKLGGSFTLSGIPESYEPGATYTITVTIDQPGQSRWGFSLAARFSRDAQAGRFEITDPENTQVYDLGAPILFVNQTQVGSRAGVPGPVSWSFDWKAPEENLADVFFNAAGNAADNNGFPTGDWIYLAEKVSAAPTGNPD